MAGLNYIREQSYNGHHLVAHYCQVGGLGSDSEPDKIRQIWAQKIREIQAVTALGRSSFTRSLRV